MNHAPERVREDALWHQVTVNFADYSVAEHVGAVHIGPIMTGAETAGRTRAWFFVRKAPCWRIRFLVAHGTGQETVVFLHERLDALRDGGHIAGWAPTIYEPEIHAFGGPLGMGLTHRLFHVDSRHVLAYLGRQDVPPTGHGDQRRELSVLLCSMLMRGAGQDWYEQGDVWARVAGIRPDPPDIPAERMNRLEADLRRLMTVDAGPTSPLLRENGPLAFLTEWAVAFAEAGQRLGGLARNGLLTRGLRAVLAHQIIFHWNRLGLPYTVQSLIAHTAKTVVLDRDEWPTTMTPLRLPGARGDRK